METTFALPNAVNPRAVPLRGRAIAALVCGFFGAVWMFEGFGYAGLATPFWLTIIGMFAAFFILWPVAQLFTLRGVNRDADRARWQASSKAYWAVVVIEWLSCTIGANWLSHIGRPELTPHAIGAIVGLHFFPLARIFRARIYNWTASAMVAGVALSFALPGWQARGLFTSVVSGLALWATATTILCHDRR